MGTECYGDNRDALYSGPGSADIYNDPVIDDAEYNKSALILPVNTNVAKEYLQNIFVVQLTLYENCLFVEDGLSDKLCIQNMSIPIKGNLNKRDYLNSVTKTRPNYYDIVPSVLLNFTVS